MHQTQVHTSWEPPPGTVSSLLPTPDLRITSANNPQDSGDLPNGEAHRERPQAHDHATRTLGESDRLPGQALQIETEYRGHASAFDVSEKGPWVAPPRAIPHIMDREAQPKASIKTRSSQLIKANETRSLPMRERRPVNLFSFQFRRSEPQGKQPSSEATLDGACFTVSPCTHRPLTPQFRS